MPKTSRPRYPFEPDYAIPPGATLQETIDVLGMSQADLALRTGLSAKTVNLIIKGKEPISRSTAVILERVVGVPARLWNNLESNYREQLAKIEDKKRLESHATWLKQSGIPIKVLVDRGFVRAIKDQVETLRDVLRFFAVKDPDAWEQTWARPASAYRKSSAFNLQPGPTATWLRLGELAAKDRDTSPYDRDAFVEALAKIRELTVKKAEDFQSEMRTLCGEAGVAVVFVPPVKGCPAYGAARWLSPQKAVIQLSLRGKFEDLFWFTFFHEAAHILNDPKRPIFLDDGKVDGECEEKANEFAANFLIPPSDAVCLRSLRSGAAIRKFANMLGISPGIVVGRLQHEGHCPRNHNNKLKRRFDWKNG